MSLFSIYDRRRLWNFVFLIFALVAIGVFLLLSNNLVKELAKQERERMNIWAQATERLASTDVDTDFEFLLGIIRQNNSIPVLVADDKGHVLEFRNFNIPGDANANKFSYMELDEDGRRYIDSRLEKMCGGQSIREAARDNDHFIEVKGIGNISQYIVYEDSILLRRLSLYPYIQLVVMIVIALIIYGVFVYTKRAEQNRVWVGLSKETAHQLGTPISSLMAWTQYLESLGIDKEVTDEIDKDVKRLSTIAERFSKIGSQPTMELEYINEASERALEYMRRRLSGKVKMEFHPSEDDHAVMLSAPLFAWVMENLTKNAVDAMDGVGRIDITTGGDKDTAFIEVADTGKGIARKNFRNVFNPGFTTKKRGWGLGLTLVKRIIEDYHRGKIYVKHSEIGKGTVFRIEIPVAH